MRNLLPTSAAAAALLAFSGVAMANPPAVPTVAANQSPGSILIWPKFDASKVTVDAGQLGQYVAATTVIEVGALCPQGGLNPACGADQTVFVHFHWVSPPPAGGTVCTETDFIKPLTYGAGHADVITFNPIGLGNPPGSDVNGNTSVPIVDANTKGFLIAWAVDAQDRPIKFDGLVGSEITRSFGTDTQYIQAYGIQADPNAEFLSVLDTRNGIQLDGGRGHYLPITGQLQGLVSIDSQINPPFTGSALILLTLDINLGLPNDPTSVGMKFYTHNNEAELSTSTSFTCWRQISLTTNPTNKLDSNLTVSLFGTDFGAGPTQRDVLMVTGQAVNAVTGERRTLLGFVQQGEGPIPGTINATRSVDRLLGSNGVAVPTTFVPLP